ncbi:catalase family peroxidase [Pseudoalteromonas sp. NZS71]|uniref:catalase family peroxidase n=1 Tax=unclassified Pseudoalteromonas TaxID=194690 RepID=UPI000C346C0C|nr:MULTISPECIES: catalase family peroxidase [unclassified Pseudoalteromonas]MBH0061031.1 catalase family peroxidase [Pseudoalteromonas sp. NZS71]PKH91879.1 catalase [Pseudoalteromonas sp. 78C3]
MSKKITLIAIITLFALTILYFTGAFNSDAVTAQRFVNLQQGDQAHAGFRRAHAKGICLAGSFESTGELAIYSQAKVFDLGATPFVGRFSIAGNNPTAPDLKAPVRSLAFSITTDDNQEWRVAMNTPPVMAVATPDAFFKQLQALSPDPVTKKRSPEKIKAFFAAHPESAAFNNWKASYKPTSSFATEQYHSINAFYLVDEHGKKHAVRWIAKPQLNDENIQPLNNDSVDALQLQLKDQVAQAPVKFDMLFSFATAEDDENNPTVLWPQSRKTINAGTLVISSLQAQEGGVCADMNFDPLVLPTGIEPSADPILRARGAAYAESFRRRAKEVLLNN